MVFFFFCLTLLLIEIYWYILAQFSAVVVYLQYSSSDFISNYVSGSYQSQPIVNQPVV